MFQREFLRECFTYSDWAGQQLLSAVADLPDSALDQQFEMGEGSLRATLNHLWAAERVWLDRWKQAAEPRFRKSAEGVTIASLREEFQATAAERNAFLAEAPDGTLHAPLTFRNLRGEPLTLPLDGLMLHVCNHGIHHRAQAVNMLKRLGGPTPRPGCDYIFMKLHEPGGGTADLRPPKLDVQSLRGFYAYADWARARTHAVAAGLGDEQLDRRFEIGLGTIRATLAHIRFAEHWWWLNWTVGPGQPFPETDPAITVAELTRLFDETVRNRESYLAGLSDADLGRPVTARPRPDVTRVFPLGVTMLQICHHGTHHRAQLLNMLRHVGAQVPGLDVALKLREG